MPRAGGLASVIGPPDRLLPLVLAGLARAPLIALALGLVDLAPPSPAAAAPAAWTARGELAVGAGHDDNVLLEASPDAPTTLRRLGGWFGQLAPALGLGVGGGSFRLEGSYTGDYRRAAGVGNLYYQEGGLLLSLPPLGPARLQVGLAAGRFDVADYPEDHFVFAGGQAGARLRLTDSLRLNLGYRAQWRRLGSGGNQASDWLHGADLRLPWAPASWLELAPRGSLLLVRPGAAAEGAAQEAFLRARGGLEASAQLGPVALAAGGWAGQVRLGGRRETHLGADLEARLPLASPLDLYAAFELVAPVSSGAGRDYARRAVTLGLTVSLAHTARRAPHPELELRPRVEAGRVRLRLRARAGADVRVLGSWDDWRAPGAPLSSTPAPGVYEAWVAVPPGSHRYHFLVDGQPQRPPDAPQYAPDGFGGEDGVIEVSPAEPGRIIQ